MATSTDLKAAEHAQWIKDKALELGFSFCGISRADFLEDEGLISVEDHLSKTYFSERKLSKGEVEKKAKEYSSKKDSAFSRFPNSLWVSPKYE
jgi:epoxyqueuosine reductase QueG